jgi:hypothetical protein
VVGGRKVAQQNRAAKEAGLQLANPMALALTDKRLLVLRVSAPLAMGKGGDVKDLVSEAPLADVESVDVKRLLVGKVVTVTVAGTPVKLEVGGGGDAKGLAGQFAQVKAAV